MDLKKIPFGTNEAFNVLVEISKGSHYKYEYDEELQAIKLDLVFKKGFTFAYNYGFVFKTKAPNGDCLDVIILSDEALVIGTIVVCRTIGMIEIVVNGKEDNKIIAVPLVDSNYENIQSINDLPESWFVQAKEFFSKASLQRKNKVFEIKSFQDKERALEELDRCKI